MSQATIPSASIHPQPTRGLPHHGRTVVAGALLAIAATVGVAVAWTHDGGSTQPTPVRAGHAAPTWNVPECPRIGRC